MSLPFQVELDRTGFPMIKVPELDAYISWLPVTKIQFEHFICDTNLYTNEWYQNILKDFTPRIAPGVMRLGDYWNVFMTGVLPAEAVRFASWMGREYRLLTSQEWKTALAVLEKYPALPEYVEAIVHYKDEDTRRSISERAALICKKLETVAIEDSNQLVGTDGRRLCDQMMMRLGVVEYVYEDNQMNTFVGWGQPNRRFSGATMNPIRDIRPVTPVNKAIGSRMKHFGFRLIRRAN